MPQLVGGLSLGFNSYHGDSPAWPNNAIFPYKEMWVFSNSRVILNLAHLGIPARVSGSAPSGAEFREKRTGNVTRVENGKFDMNLPAGEYAIIYGNITKNISLVDGTSYDLELDPIHAIEIELSAAAPVGGIVEVTARVQGSGAHELELRAFNATTEQTNWKIDLKTKTDQKLKWALKISDSNKPWVMVAIPDQRMMDRRELFGTSRDFPKLA
jgi:hypothetical protein